MNLEQIDTSTTAGKAEVMRLAAEGRRVLRTDRFTGNPPVEENPAWNWVFCDYAIISEPVGPEEVWGVVFPKHLGLWEERNVAAEHSEKTGYELVRYIRADLAPRRAHARPVLRRRKAKWLKRKLSAVLSRLEQIRSTGEPDVLLFDLSTANALCEVLSIYAGTIEDDLAREKG